MPATGTLLVNAAGEAQVASFGPRSLNRIVPVGLLPPASAAVSVTAPPSATPAEAVVVSVGWVVAPGTTVTSIEVAETMFPAPEA